MGAMASQVALLFNQPFIQAQLKKNVKVPRHLRLYGEFTQ